MSDQSALGIIKKQIYFAAILVISFAATGLFFASGVIRYWDKVLYDHCINYRVLKGQKTKSPFIATIDLDDKSREELGDQLYNFQAFADLLEVLDEFGAVLPVMDFIFTLGENQNSDFANAVTQYRKHNAQNDTITAALAVKKDKVNKPYKPLDPEEEYLLTRHIWHINVLEEGKVPEAGSFILPFSALVEAAGQIGFINMEPDSDGIYRRVPLLYKWDDGYIPSLPLAAAVKRLRIPVESIELKAGAYLGLPRSEEEMIRIPIDEQGRMLIPYTHTYVDDKDRIPFYSVVKIDDDDAFDKMSGGLSGRIALVAEISTINKDHGPTSFEEEPYPLSGVHAAVLSGILNGLNKKAFIGWASQTYKAIILVLLLAIAFFCINIQKDALFHIGFLLALLAFSGLTLFRWQNSAISPWFSFPATLLFFLWLSAFLQRLFVRYREQLLLHTALSRYFPHALAERIMREGKTDLIPAYKELTILFSDISGFTKWSSDKSPEQVHNFLSDYLESMAEILFAHGGTVDKFMGDGILSFFGDPFELPNHTEQCVKAAIAMQEKVRILAEKWKPIVDIDLKVRVGINTGKVIVGNLGNKTRIEYTVIGAAVNLAQRMESNAPVGGILVTADAWEKVKDKFAFTEKRDVTVKGYGETIEAYVVDQRKDNKTQAISFA
jgi:adenylate cyclase